MLNKWCVGILHKYLFVKFLLVYKEFHFITAFFKQKLFLGFLSFPSSPPSLPTPPQ